MVTVYYNMKRLFRSFIDMHITYILTQPFHHFISLLQANVKIKQIIHQSSSSCFPKLVENMKPKFLYVPLFYHHVEGPNYLSNKLQLICWSCYPANSIASFQPMKLVALRLHRRLQEQLQRGCRINQLFLWLTYKTCGSCVKSLSNLCYTFFIDILV